MGEFADKVFEAVRRIPRGKVATYGQIARMVGRPRSARYVGFALRSNPRPGIDPDSIPCHRVVFKDGSLCRGFAFGGPDVQYRRLVDEGVEFLRVAPAGDERAGRESFAIEEGGTTRIVDLDTLRVDMRASQWDGHDDAPDADGCPTEPPADFDWAAELGDI